jgi:DNA replication and repair protein RecF
MPIFEPNAALPLSLSLSSITVCQFKNYFQEEFTFSAPLVGIHGRNGVGKTNLLDAIHYLCFTRSYFSRSDSQNIQQGHQGFRVEGQFLLHDRAEKAVCVLRENGKKEFSVNGEAYSRFSRHIGRYPCVIIAPDDVQLIIGGSEDRRKFLDTLLSQLDANYLQHLINYTKILQQRNSFLRSYHDNYSRDISVLEVLDSQLIKEGEPLFQQRRSFLLQFLPMVKQLYNDISQRYEPINLYYESELQETSFPELLAATRQKDLLLQRSSGGIHKDDLLFRMGDLPFKSIASQGQRKSLLFALKLAEMEILRREKRFSPLLLLDDVFEKLDEERISNLLQRVCSEADTQIFITDTSASRLNEQLQKIGKPFQLIGL